MMLIGLSETWCLSVNTKAYPAITMIARVSTTHPYITCSFAPCSFLLGSPSSRKALSSFCLDSKHFLQMDHPNVFTIGFFHLAWCCPSLSTFWHGSVLYDFVWINDSPQHGTLGLFTHFGYYKFWGV